MTEFSSVDGEDELKARRGQAAGVLTVTGLYMTVTSGGRRELPVNAVQFACAAEVPRARRQRVGLAHDGHEMV